MSGQELSDKAAIVTGGGMGMGAATAELFAQHGASVLVADWDEKRGAATVQRITDSGGKASFVRADVSNAGDVRGVVDTAVERYGRVDCAVNNAAVAPDNSPVAELNEDEFDKIIRVNLRSVALCLKYEITQLLKQGSAGSIVNIGSVNSYRPQPNSSAYTAAKHGVIGLTKTASLDYAPQGIRVNAVCPGAIDTPMIRAALDRIGETEENFAPILSLFGRFGRPQEVAQASLWLCSDQSSFVTGHSLAADGGYLSR